ncbi:MULTISPECIES: GNAT family N-acetyltransferase [Actinomadura]|uniref:GNAT family N-acetyltransferase n=1 Tax=Actinomadura litoris TaxID=2678616 RepID=A0A7K1L0G6_9ACTN|nr:MULTISPECIES: GNAT family N-acetyltransferase [Actinomadura]MBT2206964.1 GNAT family N-acetyltransferase [Actinomadura sp. NEAU-AAG7]MUN37934.1 GNAT family N-acetyltransferase [Actinomadura litoris]
MASPNSVSLSGDGLVLREWRDDDLDTLVELFDDSEVARWTPLASPFDRAAAARYLARVRDNQARGERLHLAITTDGGEPKGEVMLNRVTGTIGYAIGAAHRGRGLAVRALRLLTDHAHEADGLPRVYLEIEQSNAASAAVARAAGYTLTDALPVMVEDKGRQHNLLTWVHEESAPA